MELLARSTIPVLIRGETEVQPVGGGRPVKVDLRVIAATHRDLEAMAEEETFRSDLLARVAGCVVELPPLRERREDLGLLVATIAGNLSQGARGPVRFSCDAGRALLSYQWPRNIRELEKAVVSASLLADGATVGLEHLPKAITEDSAPALPAKDAERRETLVALLGQHNGNVAAVAREMGKARMQVHRWIHRYQIGLAAFRR